MYRVGGEQSQGDGHEKHIPAGVLVEDRAARDEGWKEIEHRAFEWGHKSTTTLALLTLWRRCTHPDFAGDRLKGTMTDRL